MSSEKSTDGGGVTDSGLLKALTAAAVCLISWNVYTTHNMAVVQAKDSVTLGILQAGFASHGEKLDSIDDELDALEKRINSGEIRRDAEREAERDSR